MTNGRDWTVLTLVVVFAGGVGLVQTSSPDPVAEYLPDATKALERDFASSRACRSCHPSEYESWHDSYHRTMTQYATEGVVLAPWNDVTLTASGRSYRLHREGERFMVDMPKHGTYGTDSEDRVQRPVVMTTGSHHMQYYWIPIPWAELRLDASSQQAFNRSCASCHGKDGRGLTDGAEQDPEVLRAAGLNSGEMKGFWELAPHPKLAAALEEDERRSIESFLERISFSGRLIQFPFVYFIREGRWVRDEHTFLQPRLPHEGIEPYGNYWSGNCDECHSTGKRYTWDEDRQLGQTEVAELGIACEVCHGAAREHVARFQNPMRRYQVQGRRHTESAKLDDIVNPAKLDAKRASSICARCHSESVSKDGNELESFKPGELIEDRAHILRLVDAPFPAWMQEILSDEPDTFRNTFWPDGTIRIAGRDYNGLVESKCFSEGELSCLTCHSLHQAPPDDQLAAVARGDDVCSSCHESIATNPESHTHHPVSSEGSRCYNCHMPYTTWGLMHAVRAHRVDSPSAKVSYETGRPNACNLCHLDRTLSDVAQDLTKWYGQESIELPREERTRAASVLWLLRGDAVQRAIAAWHMSWEPAVRASGSDWQAPLLAELLDDPYAAVRFSASESLGRLPGYRGFRYDFEGSRHGWIAAAHGVRSRFRALTRSDEDRPWLLLRRGFLDKAAADALVRRRDDTPVTVAE